MKARSLEARVAQAREGLGLQALLALEPEMISKLGPNARAKIQELQEKELKARALRA